MSMYWRHCAVIGCENIETNEKINYHMFPKNEDLRSAWLKSVPINPIFLELAKIKLSKLSCRFGVCGLHFEPNQYQTSEKKKLNRNAVPTIYHEETQSYHKPEVISQEEETVTIPEQPIAESPIHDEFPINLYEEYIKLEEEKNYLDVEQDESELSESSHEQEQKAEEKPVRHVKMKSWRKCAVSHCENAKTNWNARYFMFPTDPKLLEEWLKVIKNPDLSLLQPGKIRFNYGVCLRHFENHQFKSLRKLTLKSNSEIPCKFLYEMEPGAINGLLLQVDKSNVGKVVSKIQMSVTTAVTEIDTKSSCRVCLTKTDPQNLYCLFGTSVMFQDLSIAAALLDCFSIDLQEDPELPNYVCINCASSTLQAYTFKRCILQCQTVLRKQKVVAEELNLVDSTKGILYDSLTKKKPDSVVENINNEITSNVEEKYDPLFDHCYTKEVVKGENDETVDVSSTTDSAKQGSTRKRKKMQSQVDKWWTKDKGPPYQCRVCGRHYGVRFYAFYIHVRTHRMNKPMCSYCGKRFTRDKMIVHIRSHTKERPFVCDKCPARFTSDGNLKRHQRLHTGEKLFVCDECGKAFSQSTTLMGHKKIHSKDVQLICEYCGKCCISNGRLQRHIRQTHMLIKNEDEDLMTKFSCHQCDKVFKTMASLNLHSKIHVAVKLECNLCSKTLYSHNNLDIHMLWHRVVVNNMGDDQINKWECEICNETYEDRQLLASHILTHSDQQFDCDYCSKSFFSKAALVQHTRRHSDERPFTCHSCPKTFKYIATFKQHEKVHTGEKPYKCDICSRQFAQQQQIISHRYTHTGEKKYVCPYCGKAFALNGNLTVHKRRHTGETPYVCDVCLKGFYDSSSLKKHRATQHNS